MHARAVATDVGTTLFEDWAAERQALKGRARLSAASVAQYQLIWTAWLRHLAGQGIGVAQADAAEVDRFVASITSPAAPAGPVGQQRGRRAVSPVTQARYFTVLAKVYHWGLTQGRVPSNPASRDPGQPRLSERSAGLVLHSGQWLQVASLANEWPEPRERAMLMLLVHLGLTAGELLALNLDSVRHPRLVFTAAGARLAPPGPSAGDGPSVALRVGGARASQERDLDLPVAVGDALLDYLALRLASGRLTHATGPLFLSRKSGAGRSAPADLGRMRRQTVFQLARQLVATALGELHYHNGPAVLRNSAIVRWLHAGVPEQEVLVLAGLKSPQALRRLGQQAL